MCDGSEEDAMKERVRGGFPALALLAARRTMAYAGGLFLLAMGTVLSVRSGLGVSPVNALPYVVSIITAGSLGVCATLTFCGFIGLQALLLGREFGVRHLAQILCASVFGYFVAVAEAVVAILPGEMSYLERWGMLAGSMVLVAVGIVTYLGARLVPMPVEGLLQAVQAWRGTSLAKAKVQFDVCSVAVAVALAGLFLGEVPGIREGTVISVFGVGAIIRMIRRA